MSTLGERIKLIRTNNNLKQEDFARSLSVSRSFISRIESGKENASETVLKLMSLQFNVSLQWLLYGKGAYSANKNNDYFERGYEQEYKSEIIPSFKRLLDELDNINSASLYLSVGAIINEYTNLLKQYKNTKNIGIVVFDELSNAIIGLLNTTFLCENEISKTNSYEIERKFASLSEDINNIIFALKDNFTSRTNQ